VWRQYECYFVKFKEDGSWEKHNTVQAEEKLLILIIHDKSTFNANNGKRRIWKVEGEQLLHAKGRRKGIMVSGFLTPGGRLKVPAEIPDSELLNNLIWPLSPDGKPVRDTMEFLEYGKDSYWTGDKMVEHTVRAALPIFQYAFPGCKGLWVFDNALNHNWFALDALVAATLN